MVKGLSNNGHPFRVFVVDDSATQRALVAAALKAPKYEVTFATSGKEGLAVLNQRARAFDVIMLDISIGEESGFDLLSHIRATLNMPLLPVFMVSSHNTVEHIQAAIDAGACEYIVKPFDNADLVKRVEAAVDRKRSYDHLEHPSTVLYALARMAEGKDRFMGRHCDRLVNMSEVFGKTLGLSNGDVESLKEASILHDIGKLAIPDAILMKPGPLTFDEWSLIRKHTLYGALICKNMNAGDAVVEIVRHHHEHYNGSGYPSGLRGDKIPYLARVFQVLDIFDALSTDRIYSRAYPLKTAVHILNEETAKGYWDRDIVMAFMEILRTKPHELQLVVSADDTEPVRELEKTLGKCFSALNSRKMTDASDERR